MCSCSRDSCEPMVPRSAWLSVDTRAYSAVFTAGLCPVAPVRQPNRTRAAASSRKLVARGQRRHPSGMDTARRSMGRDRRRWISESIVDAGLTRARKELGSCSLKRPGGGSSTASLTVTSIDRPGASRGGTMPEMDPTFYRSPTAAVAAVPEQLAYVVAFDPTGRRKTRSPWSTASRLLDVRRRGRLVRAADGRQRAAPLRLERVLERAVSRGARRPS